MIFLVTGVAGFIGFHVTHRLLTVGHTVIGIDNLNKYYNGNLKQARLNQISHYSTFTFIKMDIINSQAIFSLFSKYQFEYVIHLGAQAGVRFSIENSHIYAETNLIGHLNILEACRHYKIKHLIYASSSSVYGLNKKMPFSTKDSVDHPISLYAATKKSNELMSHAYSYLYKLPTTGLRFFTVYGPWGRPDMAIFKFTRAILNGEKINIYNYGRIKRDFTYIDDIVEAIIRLCNLIPQANEEWDIETGAPSSSVAAYRVFNIGNGHPVSLLFCIELLEKTLGIKAKRNMLHMQLGDMVETSADTQELYHAINFRPLTSIEYGIQQFVNWYCDFYKK